MSVWPKGMTALAVCLLLSAGAAAAQPSVEIEAGVGALHVPHWDDTSGTGYIGASLIFANRIAAYGAINGGVEGFGRGGVEVRLGSAAWLVRPTVRAGVFGAEEVFGTAGVGLRIGRRAGGRFTVEWTTRDAEYGLSSMLLHFGAYYAF